MATNTRRSFTDAQRLEIADNLIHGRMTLQEACQRYDIQTTQAYAFVGQRLLSNRSLLEPQTVNSTTADPDPRTVVLAALGEAFAKLNGITLPEQVAANAATLRHQ